MLVGRVCLTQQQHSFTCPSWRLDSARCHYKYTHAKHCSVTWQPLYTIKLAHTPVTRGCPLRKHRCNDMMSLIVHVMTSQAAICQLCVTNGCWQKDVWMITNEDAVEKSHFYVPFVTSGLQLKAHCTFIVKDTLWGTAEFTVEKKRTNVTYATRRLVGAWTSTSSHESPHGRQTIQMFTAW